MPGTLIMWNLVSLDGCFEGERSWELAWHEQVWGEELERFSIEQLKAADALVFGRVTYEGMAAHWTSARGEIADYMNDLPKVVCSRSLQRADWHNTTLVRDDAAAAIARLKRESRRSLFVFGSANLSRTLIEAGLFDEYRLGLAPLILGRGRPLFGQPLRRQPLALIDSRALSNGCLILRYRPAG